MKKVLLILFTSLLIIGLVAGLTWYSSKAKVTEPVPEKEVARVVEEFIKARHDFHYETYTGMEGLEEYTEDPIYSALKLNAEGFSNKAKEQQATKEITRMGAVAVTMIAENKAETKVEFTVDWTKNGVTETLAYVLTATLEKFEDQWLITLINGPI